MPGTISARALIRTLAGLAVTAAVFMLVAGRVDLPFVWAYLALATVMAIDSKLHVDPDLVRERRKPGGTTPDPWRLRAMQVTAAAHVLVALLDVGRLHWTDTVPTALRVALLPVLAGGWWLVIRAMSANRFFTAEIRIQEERGHHLVTGGPYGWVRHPGYAGLIPAVVAGALVLGSWLALVPAALFALIVVWRAADEDRFLRALLPGYDEYAARVRWRLLPGVW